MCLENIDILEIETVFSLFINHSTVLVSESTLWLDENSQILYDVIIIVPDSPLIEPAEEILTCNDDINELRQVSMLWNNERNNEQRTRTR